MGEETSKIQFMMRLFKNAFKMYKDNFKAYTWFILIYFSVNGISLIQEYYFKADVNTIYYYIIMFANMSINVLLAITLKYYIYLKQKSENEIKVVDLLKRIRNRFWKYLWTVIKLGLKCMLIILIIIVVTIVLAIIISLSSIFKFEFINNANLPYIYMSIILPIIIFLIAIKYAFVDIIAIVENDSEKPFVLNKNILKGNYKLVISLLVVLLIPITIIIMVSILIKDLSVNIRFTIQLIMGLINNIITPFVFASQIFLYNYLKSKYDEKTNIDLGVEEMVVITETNEIDE